MAEMTEKHLACFKHFLAAYQNQWKLNKYQREKYDEQMGHYVSYRDETDYPLAYSMVFNKLMPRVTNVLARFMEHLYQGGSHNLVSVRPRRGQDVERASRVEGLLNFQLEKFNDVDECGGSYMHNYVWLLNALAWGNGITKCYWRKEDRVTPKRIMLPVPEFDEAGEMIGLGQRDVLVEMPQTVYDQPYGEIIHNKNFVPHPHYKNIQQMPFVFCVYKRSMDYIKKRADEGVFIKKYISNLGWHKEKTPNYPLGDGYGASNDAAEAFARSIDIDGVYEEDFQSDRISPSVDVIEGYGKYIFPEDERPYEVGSGFKIKGPESEAIVHIGNYKTLLSIQKNKYGVRPFYKTSAYYHPELFWDLGFIEVGKHIQEQVNTLANTRYQNAIMMANNMFYVREDWDGDPAALVPKPAGIIPVEDPSNPDVLPVPLMDASQSNVFREQEEFFEATISEMTGEYPYSMGQQPPRQEYVGTMVSLQNVGQARARLLMMTIDHQGFQPMLKHMMRLNTFHLPAGMETRITANGQTGFVPLFSGDMHFDYDFTARYTAMEPALGKYFKAQQLTQYAQMWAESPYLQHDQFMRAILEMLDFPNTDKYLKSRQQVAQEMQQQQTMQMQQVAVQDQLDANKSQRESQRDVLKGLMK
jgi:hypothetical protein